MPSAWILHIKDFAAKNNLSYPCAMTDPQCKATYVSVKKPTKKVLKQKLALALSKPSFVLADGKEIGVGPTGRLLMPKIKKKPVKTSLKKRGELRILTDTFEL